MSVKVVVICINSIGVLFGIIYIFVNEYIQNIYDDTKLNYKLYILATDLLRIKSEDGRILDINIIKSLLQKKSISEKLDLFLQMLGDDYFD
jgi:hypothetical protein